VPDWFHQLGIIGLPRHLALREHGDELKRNVDCGLASFVDHLVPAAPLLLAHHDLVTARQHIEETHTVRVISDNHKIQRAPQLCLVTAGRDDLLATGESVGIIQSEAIAKDPRIHR
jgi:hypothetical protein